MRSELAAGVDITFLSDHDSVINNEEMRALSNERGMPFIPAMELSPSWGHFNAYPIDGSKSVEIDSGTATAKEVFVEARRLGADVIEVNHPYSTYGYFRNDENSTVSGEFDPGFDLVEITPVIDNYNEPGKNKETLERVWKMWNDGQRAYLAAGSDVHDVWKFETGRARTYARIEGELNINKYVAALKAGHSFASQGPLVYPEILFGNEVHQSAGDDLALAYAVQAVSGLSSVQLIERGDVIETLLLDGESEPVQVDFLVRPEANTWYSLVVEDQNGKFAYTNPVWVVVNP
jgi:hypothetical protein